MSLDEDAIMGAITERTGYTERDLAEFTREQLIALLESTRRTRNQLDSGTIP